MLLYVSMKEKLCNPEIGEYDALGIAAFEAGKKVMAISDVSTVKEIVEALAIRCSQAQLSPLHLYDVILDALS